ncbi:hypothetical protein DMH02_029540 [Streptomyces sp. WAC 00631]|uniref:hypothetical protein n=1 Tax=Streptomyces TaxID=1883 RepID=UPI000F790C16|nr:MULTISPECIES: hypothetical protein [Streptomyces]MCC5037208.1 hypothetical protein [Streptomyces sp. WAC 00631]MCC9737810.1 hypothetical protein [Streptomyces sp. MNU89]WSQ74891.1 hypothetical protein OG463_28215 [Streptomyces xinghaiensis]
MPALNIDFSDEELAELREAARERGVTLKALVREAVTDDLARRRAMSEAGQIFRSFVVDNADAFDEAFPEDAPAGAGGTRRGAA